MGNSGDAGTKFFHANAAIRQRRNMIASLKTESEDTVTSHSDKEQLLWEFSKQRIGQSDFKGILFDLPSLIQTHEGLESLAQPFTAAEIDDVVKHLPNDKSPGLDGFSNEFIKKCWSTIKTDFYNLCWDFQANNVCLQSINSSFITLVPKSQSPSSVSDFRPISLLNSSMKIITKFLTNRLQGSIFVIMGSSIADPFKIVLHGPLNISISVIIPKKR